MCAEWLQLQLRPAHQEAMHDYYLLGTQVCQHLMFRWVFCHGHLYDEDGGYPVQCQAPLCQPHGSGTQPKRRWCRYVPLQASTQSTLSLRPVFLSSSPDRAFSLTQLKPALKSPEPHSSQCSPGPVYSHLYLSWCENLLKSFLSRSLSCFPPSLAVISLGRFLSMARHESTAQGLVVQGSEGFMSWWDRWLD